MTLEACYASMGGDLDGVRKRMLSDDRIIKFLGIFKEDSSMATLRESIAQGDLQTAFRAAHTIKGIGRDLGLTKLYTVAEVLADVLRPDDSGVAAGPLEDVDDLMEKMESAYASTIESIAMIQKEHA